MGTCQGVENAHLLDTSVVAHQFSPDVAYLALVRLPGESVAYHLAH